MPYALIDKLVFLTTLVVVAWMLWLYLPFRQEWSARREAKAQAKREKREAEKEVTVPAPPVFHPVFEEKNEYTVSPLVVHHLSDKATLLLRHRRKKEVSTAHLIVWSGAKRRTIQDSYYDLGIIPGAELSEQVVEQFVAMARQRLEELAVGGRRQRREAKVSEAPVVQVVDPVPAEVVAAPPLVGKVEEPTVTVDETPPEAVKLRKFPSVHRGVIQEIGMMPQTKGGREFTTFGVRFTTAEGYPDAVFGANLREALRQAGAGVGDTVEILKIGRKTISKDKAPMNLFTVAKIGPAPIAEAAI